MNVGDVIFLLFLLGLQTCNSWRQQRGVLLAPRTKITPSGQASSLYLEQLHLFRDAVTWDTPVPIIWTPAGCISTDGRTWEDKDIATAGSSHAQWATSSLQVARQKGQESWGRNLWAITFRSQLCLYSHGLEASEKHRTAWHFENVGFFTSTVPSSQKMHPTHRNTTLGRCKRGVER